MKGIGVGKPLQLGDDLLGGTHPVGQRLHKALEHHRTCSRRRADHHAGLADGLGEARAAQRAGDCRNFDGTFLGKSRRGKAEQEGE